MRALSYLATIFCLCLVLSACQANNPLAVPTDTPAPPTVTPLPTPSPTPQAGTIAGFDAFLNQAESRKPDQRQDLANRFVGQLRQTPLTGENEAIFLYRGAAQSVQLLGDMNNWDIDLAPSLTRLDGSDLWYWRAAFESDARLDYQLLIDGRQQILDPLNPDTVPGPQGPNSEMRMPAYETPPELAPSTGQIPSGTLTSHTLESQHLGQTRTFQVYDPPGQIVGQPLPSLYINGGSDYLNLIDTPAMLDRLIAQRQIPPLVAVFIPPINASQDYALNEAYADFMAEELAPYIRERFGVSADPAQTGILGNSLGGLAAVHTAVTRSDVFGLAVAQSARFGQQNETLTRYVSRQQAGRAGFDPPQLYLVVGTYETAVEGQDGPEDILEANRKMADALDQAGFNYMLDERPEGHSWGLWRGSFGRALGYLFGRAS